MAVQIFEISKLLYEVGGMHRAVGVVECVCTCVLCIFLLFLPPYFLLFDVFMYMYILQT